MGEPAGASITSAGVFTWTPTDAQGPGVYTFKVQVSDGTATTESSIALTVTEDNVAPVLTDVPATATIPEGVEYTFTAHATDADLPVQTLAFSLSGEPAGASITSAGVFTWTPTDAQGPGVYTFKVQVSDGTATTESSIALTVTEDNVAPVLTDVPATATIPEGVEYTFTAHATDSDLPVQTLAFSLSGEPAGASITSGWSIHLDSGRCSGPGVYTFKVQVSDGTATTESSIALTVTEDNVAPVLTDVPATATIPEGVEYTFTAHATDADFPAQTLAFSLSGEPPVPVLLQLEHSPGLRPMLRTRGLYVQGSGF